MNAPSRASAPRFVDAEAVARLLPFAELIEALRKAFAATDLVAPQRREHFIALIRSLAEMVEAQTTLDLVSDAEDNPVLAVAVDSHADFLVTGDPHLLAVQDYEGCKIVSPAHFLAMLLEEEQTD